MIIEINVDKFKEYKGFYKVINSKNIYPCSLFTCYDNDDQITWCCIKGLYQVFKINDEIKDGIVVEIRNIRRGINRERGEIEKDIETIEEFKESVYDEIGYNKTLIHNFIWEEGAREDHLLKEKQELEIEKERRKEVLRLRTLKPKIELYSKIYKGKRSNFYEIEFGEEDEKLLDKNGHYSLLTCFLINKPHEQNHVFKTYYEDHLTFYCIKGDDFVQFTPEYIRDFTNLSEISYKVFKKNTVINSLEELENIVIKEIESSNYYSKMIKTYSSSFEFDFGKYDEWILKEVMKIDPNYINWCVSYRKDLIFSGFDFKLSKKANRINEIKEFRNRERDNISYNKTFINQRYSGSVIIDDEDIFDALTDGQYGSYDDYNGDIDDLKDGMGL